MLCVAQVGSIIREAEAHLHAIALHPYCIHTSLLQAADKDTAGDDLIASDQGFRMVRAKEDEIGCNKDGKQGLLVLGVDLHVEDTLAHTDPILEGGMVLDGGCMADKLDWGY